MKRISTLEKKNMSRTVLSLGMLLGLLTFFVLPLGNVSAGNWNTGTKTERSKIADGVYVERKINKKTGKVESEVTLVRTSNGYFQAEQKADGSWGLSAEGQAAQEQAAISGGDSGGGSGGGGGC